MKVISATNGCALVELTAEEVQYIAVALNNSGNEQDANYDSMYPDYVKFGNPILPNSDALWEAMCNLGDTLSKEVTD